MRKSSYAPDLSYRRVGIGIVSAAAPAAWAHPVVDSLQLQAPRTRKNPVQDRVFKLYKMLKFIAIRLKLQRKYFLVQHLPGGLLLLHFEK